MPLKIWDKLYPHQQDSIRWLYTLHRRRTGGILGDEMGLGKTVQVITFLYGIEYNKLSRTWVGLGPTLIVCPATVMHLWVKHIHDWAPEFRVAVLHASSTFVGPMSRLANEIYESKGILIVTYQGILKHQDCILNYRWHYVILDEGHKIRTPTSKVTLVVKRLVTTHRLILTGTPMQNNLLELWSLFDFTNPGLLGSCEIFDEHFAKPIIRGGYENAPAVQKQIALTVAASLKNIISPYLLRRTKKEVQDHIALPGKSEQVLFCALTDEQKKLYKDYLLSEQVGNVLEKGKNWFRDTSTRAKVFVAITMLRKLCNHPDLFIRNAAENLEDQVPDEPLNFDVRFDYRRSGKMRVLSALLKIWKRQGNRVLLFAQGRATLNILQHFLDKNDYTYLKMEGTTPISSRHSLIHLFNHSTEHFVFLLTTRVGGLGINLIGANRVIIFDPDWNPATDSQARERAWRIGQSRDVNIYRFVSSGTIEEKIYQRQVWKQFLSNRVLVDPRVDKHIFKSSDLFDLFSLNETDSSLETANIFQDAQVKIPEIVKAEQPADEFSEEKIREMKELAHKIALSFPQKKQTVDQQELADERAKKLEEKEKLKTLSAPELLQLNREKANTEENPWVNKVDDADTPASFSEALEYTEATSRLHTELVQGKKKPADAAEKTNELKLKMKMKSASSVDQNQPSTSYAHDNSSKKKKLPKKSSGEEGYKTYVDHSGAVDDEKVEGLVKAEIKLRKKRKVEKVESQDDYVLRSLLKTAGVSGVLEHETVIQGSSKGTLRLQMEAEERARKSVEALRWSRLDNFKWDH
ncbi:unnamed protein product [Callosobruchus maculatus]|nr:unnamed protein product [Callosobruchus maculatus]